MQENYTIRDLIQAGLHLGHKTKKWNPKMKPYIYGSRNDLHIIDLRKTFLLLKDALEFIKGIAETEGKILFIGTKLQATDIIKKHALECNQYYVNKRWLGGMLTNWSTISNSIDYLNDLDKELSKSDGGFKKKEILQMNRQKSKIEKSLGGLKNMGNLPEALFVVDVNKDSLAVSEANKLKIPVIAILDSNSSPIGIDYPIPGNDDSRKSIELICSLISKKISKNFKKKTIDSNKDINTIKGVKIPSKKEVKEVTSKKKKTNQSTKKKLNVKKNSKKSK